MKEYYESKEAYIEEVIEWIRNWIRLYRHFAVSLDESGSLIQIKGNITFGNDLELSLNGQMSEEEKQQYEEEAEKLRSCMEVFRRKAAASFKRRIDIPAEYLFRVFKLSPAARFCFLMSMAAEYDRTIGRMFSLLQDDYKEKYPSLDLCLKLYTSREKERFRFRQELLSEDSGFQKLMYTPLESSWNAVRLHPRILGFLENLEEEDRQLQGAARLQFFSEENYHGNEELPERLENAGWREGKGNVCFICGPDGVGKRTLAGQTAARRKSPVLFVDVRALQYEKGKRELWMQSIEREIQLWGAVPCCTHGESLIPQEADSEEIKRQKEALMEMILAGCLKNSPCLLITSTKKWEGRWHWPQVDRTDWELPFPAPSDQIHLWEMMLNETQARGLPVSSVTPEGLSVRFSLTPGQMTEALQEAVSQSLAEGKGELNKDMLYNSCRRQLVMNLGDHVTRIAAQYQWDDLVLPRRQKEMLKSACDQVEYIHQVYDLWGFDRKIAYGKGVSMMFYGPPGTGKTMGAQVIANQLSMELYKVDLSSVMSKYIGETEKNLGKIFDEVKKSRSILFFDEADALFGKRTEVKDSHDKYANAETAYLLQKIEEYQGVVILATNYMQNFDEAFKRRIKFMIEFPFPLAPYRLEMWKKVFPQATPLEDLDYEYLAERFELSGSSIKNIAVAAAFLAAPEKEKVGMKQVLHALKNEMLKSGKSMPMEAFGEYAELIEDTY